MEDINTVSTKWECELTERPVYKKSDAQELKIIKTRTVSSLGTKSVIFDYKNGATELTAAQIENGVQV